jgi:hypothetical protein
MANTPQPHVVTAIQLLRHRLALWNKIPVGGIEIALTVQPVVAQLLPVIHARPIVNFAVILIVCLTLIVVEWGAATWVVREIGVTVRVVIDAVIALSVVAAVRISRSTFRIPPVIHVDTYSTIAGLAAGGLICVVRGVTVIGRGIIGGVQNVFRGIVRGIYT